MKIKFLLLASLFLFLSCSNDDQQIIEEQNIVDTQESRRYGPGDLSMIPCPKGEYYLYHITYTNPSITEAEKQVVRDRYINQYGSGVFAGFCEIIGNTEIWYGYKITRPSPSSDGDPDVDF